MSGIFMGLYRVDTVLRHFVRPLFRTFFEPYQSGTRFKRRLLFIFKGSFDGEAGVDLFERTSCLGALHQSDAAH